MAINIPSFQRFGGFLFTSSMDGWDGDNTVPDIAEQCEASYSRLAQVLGENNIPLENVVRLDHYTASQGWLTERQQIRASFFGNPCKLASTGVAVAHREGLAVSTALIAHEWKPPRDILTGEAYGMPAITTSVEAADHLFVSGILKTSPDADMNVAAAISEIEEIVRLSGYGGARPVRFDVYVGQPPMVLSARQAIAASFGDACPVFASVLPFADDAMIEVTSLFAKTCTGIVALATASGSFETVVAHVRAEEARAAHMGYRIARLDLRHPPGDDGDATRLFEGLALAAPPACVRYPGGGESIADAPYAVSGFLAKEV